MSKKRKTPATSKKSARKTEAPMLVTRASDTTRVDEAIVAMPLSTAQPAAPEPQRSIAVQPPVVMEAELDRAQVARLAFAKFAARGYVHGYHVEDWFAAEAELRTARR